MDKMQEDFEAWHKSVVEGEPPHEKYNSGDYRNQHVQRYWLGWKARHESLVIELPDDGIEDCRKEWPERGEKYGYDTFDTGYLYACKKHEEAIKAAGLKVAP